MHNLNWEMISAIGQILSSIAMFLTVYITLYQMKITKIKKLKMSFDTIFISPWNNDQGFKGVCLKIVNIGIPKIELLNWGIVHRKGRCVIFPTDLIRKYGLFKRETTIYNDDDYYYYDDNEHFLDTIKLLIEDECIKIDDTVTLYVQEKSGKMFKHNSQYTYNQIIKKIERNNN